jgi:pimeloyl-ACP methyl ester carboxylesterase
MPASSSSTIRPEFRAIDGLAVRVAESEGTATRDTQALLLSPWPESIYAFEPTWTKLAAHAHLVAVDLPGFGHSERRDALMSPRAMGEFIVRLADELGLEQPHVVGPDIGTPAALFSAALHPGRLRSLIVGTGATLFPLEVGARLQEWIEAPDLEPYRRIDGRDFVNVANRALEHYELSEAAREDYLSAYAGERFAESMRFVRAYPTDLPALAALLPKIKTPVQIIAGRRDPVVPLVNAEFLVERLPNSELAVIEAGHRIWEDGADEYAAITTSWWGGGYIAAGRQTIPSSQHHLQFERKSS